jgi:hypothetical protein
MLVNVLSVKLISTLKGYKNKAIASYDDTTQYCELANFTCERGRCKHFRSSARAQANNVLFRAKNAARPIASENN